MNEGKIRCGVGFPKIIKCTQTTETSLCDADASRPANKCKHKQQI